MFLLNGLCGDFVEAQEKGNTFHYTSFYPAFLSLDGRNRREASSLTKTEDPSWLLYLQICGSLQLHEDKRIMI